MIVFFGIISLLMVSFVSAQEESICRVFLTEDGSYYAADGKTWIAEESWRLPKETLNSFESECRATLNKAVISNGKSSEGGEPASYQEVLDNCIFQKCKDSATEDFLVNWCSGDFDHVKDATGNWALYEEPRYGIVLDINRNPDDFTRFIEGGICTPQRSCELLIDGNPLRSPEGIELYRKLTITREECTYLMRNDDNLELLYGKSNIDVVSVCLDNIGAHWETVWAGEIIAEGDCPQLVRADCSISIDGQVIVSEKDITWVGCSRLHGSREVDTQCESRVIGPTGIVGVRKLIFGEKAFYGLCPDEDFLPDWITNLMKILLGFT